MTDDELFSRSLRDRLHDLAGAETGFEDPLPEIRRRATVADDDNASPAVVSLDRPRARRRWLSTLAVAAVVLGVLALGGFGIAAVVRGQGGESGSAASQPFDAAVSEPTAAAGGSTGSGNSGSGSNGSSSGSSESAGGSAGSCATTAGCVDTVGCAPAGELVSTGPLAGIATIRPSGIVGAHVGPGGTAAIPYVLSFTADGPTVQAQPSSVALRVGSRSVMAGVPQSSDAARTLPVTAGYVESGSASFAAVDCQGQPLPAGEYQAVVVVAYTDSSGGSFQLVSSPDAVTVS